MIMPKEIVLFFIFFSYILVCQQNTGNDLISRTAGWRQQVQIYNDWADRKETKWNRFGSGAHQPAVNHHGPSIGQGLGLDSPNKPQQACGVIGHAVVRPAREVKLSDLPDLMSPSLRNRVIMLNTQSTAEHGGLVVRRQRVQCADDVRGPSKANTELDWKQTHTSWVK